MRKELEGLDGSFDLLIIGGGIAGAWAALDAVQRGLKVCLVEQGTSPRAHRAPAPSSFTGASGISSISTSAWCGAPFWNALYS